MSDGNSGLGGLAARATGTEWMHPDSKNMYVAQAKRRRILLRSKKSRAWLSVVPGLKSSGTWVVEYHLAWNKIGSTDGKRLLTTLELRRAFQVDSKDEDPDGHAMFIADGKFHRSGLKLQVPCTMGGATADGSPVIDISVTEEMKKAVLRLIAARQN